MKQSMVGVSGRPAAQMKTREAVLDALRSAQDRGVSGQALASSLGVSRVAVRKHVAALRAEGYGIDALPGRGYTLRSVPDAPLPGEVVRLLNGGFWTRVTGGGETGSTNDDARALARASAEKGTVVLASRQVSGRGRLGRTWESPEGGAYFSMVLRPSVSPADASSLALAVAVGIAEGLEALGVGVTLKWPNDVFLGEGKVAGVLLEMTAEADRVDWVIVGIGVNVRRSSGSVTSAPGAAYLRDHADVPVYEVVATLLNAIATVYAKWDAGGFGSIRESYQRRLAMVGSPVRVTGLDGAVRADGIAIGVDDEGRLLVEAGDGIAAVASGEVTLRTQTP